MTREKVCETMTEHTLANRTPGNSGYKAGCRCEECRAGHAESNAAKRARRRQRERGATSELAERGHAASVQVGGLWAPEAGPVVQVAPVPSPVTPVGVPTVMPETDDPDDWSPRVLELFKQMVNGLKTGTAKTATAQTSDDNWELEELAGLAYAWDQTYPEHNVRHSVVSSNLLTSVTIWIEDKPWSNDPEHEPELVPSRMRYQRIARNASTGIKKQLESERDNHKSYQDQVAAARRQRDLALGR